MITYTLCIQKMLEVNSITNEEAEANRKLMEVAPELFNSLRNALIVMEKIQFGQSDCRLNLMPEIKQIRNLIKRITS